MRFEKVMTTMVAQVLVSPSNPSLPYIQREFWESG